MSQSTATARPTTPDSQRRAPRLPRRKACDKCASFKVRCDHRRPVCSRCRLRKLECRYVAQDFPIEPQPSTPRQIRSNNRHIGDAALGFSGYATDLPNPSLQAQELAQPGLDVENSGLYQTGEQPDFSAINLICPIDHEQIQNRWLEGFASTTHRQLKNLSPGVTFFVLTVLRSYPRMLTKAMMLPPFIHQKQLRNRMLPAQLARCANVAHMFVNQVPGGEDMVRDLIKGEMDKLSVQDPELDNLSRLASLQAYFLYALMLLPEASNEVVVIEQGTMLHLQKAASDIARTGLVCPSEQTNDRPDWASWIVAETKRRTLFAIYMFDDVVNTMNGLPCILGDELGMLPITCSKSLWTAVSKNVWEHEYTNTLCASKHLRLFELWIHPADAETRRRRDQWLAGIDEYGMAIYSVASITQLT